MFKTFITAACAAAICFSLTASACEAKTFKAPVHAPAAQQRNLIGDKKTKKYHMPTCKKCPSVMREVVFDSPTSANISGYKPCKKCNPPAVK